MEKNKDLRGRIIAKLRRIRLGIESFISTKYTSIDCRIKGIKLGKNCIFYGIPELVRVPNSRVTIGSNCGFRSSFSSNLIGLNRKCLIAALKTNAEIVIGDNTGLSGTVIVAAGKITIGKNVMCGGNITITDCDWHGIQPDKRHVVPEPVDVNIEDNVWIGVNSTVLKGVTIGENSVIAANSVVIKDIPPNVIAAGNPCKVIKQIS